MKALTWLWASSGQKKDIEAKEKEAKEQPSAQPYVEKQSNMVKQITDIISGHNYSKLTSHFFQRLGDEMELTTSESFMEKLELNLITYYTQLSKKPPSQDHESFFATLMNNKILENFSKQTQQTIKTIYKNVKALSTVFAIIRKLTKQQIDEESKEILISPQPTDGSEMQIFTQDHQNDISCIKKKVIEIERDRISDKAEIRHCLEDLIKTYGSQRIIEIHDTEPIDIKLICKQLKEVISSYIQRSTKIKTDEISQLSQKIRTEMQKRNYSLNHGQGQNPNEGLLGIIDSVFTTLDSQNKLHRNEVDEKNNMLTASQVALKEKDLRVASLEKEVQSLKSLQASLRKESQGSKDSANQWKSKYDNLKPEHDKMVVEFAQSKKKAEDLQEKVRILEQQNQEYKNKLIDDLRQIGQLSEQKKVLEGQVSLMSGEVDKLAKLNRSNQKTLQTQSETINRQKDCITELEEERERLDHNLSTKNQQVSALGQEIHSLQAKNSELEERLSDLDPYDKLFSHQILDGRSQEKQFLAETLEKRYNSPVQNTKLICKLDPLNKINFHRYLDGVSCLMIIAHLENQKMVAAFTLSPFLQGKKGEDALLFSIHNRQVYELKQGARAITYDDYFLIFGNSELRFKTCQSLVFSNFAVNNGYFNSRGDTVDVLFGQGPKKREMPIIGYQVYQVRFKSGLHLKYQQ